MIIDHGEVNWEQWSKMRSRNSEVFIQIEVAKKNLHIQKPRTPELLLGQNHALPFPRRKLPRFSSPLRYRCTLGNATRFRPLGGIAKENKAHNFDVRSNSLTDRASKSLKPAHTIFALPRRLAALNQVRWGIR